MKLGPIAYGHFLMKSVLLSFEAIVSQEHVYLFDICYLLFVYELRVEPSIPLSYRFFLKDRLIMRLYPPVMILRVKYRNSSAILVAENGIQRGFRGLLLTLCFLVDRDRFPNNP